MSANEPAVMPPPKDPMLLVLPTVHPSILEIWFNTPFGYGPQIASTNRFVRDQKIQLLVFIIDPHVEEDTHWQYDVHIVRPDGEAGTAETALPLKKGQSLRAGGPQIADALLTLIHDEEEPFGKYHVSVVATDIATERSIKRDFTYELLTLENLVDWTEPKDYSAWFTSYHLQPEPHRLPGYLQAVVNDPALHDRNLSDLSELGALLGFFDKIWQENTWLRPALIEHLDGPNDRTRRFLAALIAYALREDPDIVATLPKTARDRINSHRETAWPKSKPTPVTPVALDVKWGEFFATGSMAPIRSLVGVLDGGPEPEAMQTFRELPPDERSPDLQVKVARSILFSAAQWSLTANHLSHPLVRAYLIQFVEKDELSESERFHVDEVLRSRDPTEIRDRYR